MRKKFQFLIGLVLCGALTANSNPRTEPETIILDEAPKEKYPLEVSGSFPIKVQAKKEQESRNENQPQFEISSPFKNAFGGRKTFEKVSDGWLVAIDAGEWGAWLGWYSESGKEHYKISDASVFEFVRFHGQLYAFGGGCGGNDGKYGFLAKIYPDSGLWVFDEIETFPNCVLAVTETQTYDYDHDPDFLVLTCSLIYLWSNTKGKELLHGQIGWHDPARGTWSNKNPNSIVKDLNENFLIGTDYGIVAILRNRGAVEFPMGLKNVSLPQPERDTMNND